MNVNLTTFGQVLAFGIPLAIVLGAAVFAMSRRRKSD
jgi:hypothetical protein